MMMMRRRTDGRHKINIHSRDIWHKIKVEHLNNSKKRCPETALFRIIIILHHRKNLHIDFAMIYAP